MGLKPVGSIFYNAISWLLKALLKNEISLKPTKPFYLKLFYLKPFYFGGYLSGMFLLFSAFRLQLSSNSFNEFYLGLNNKSLYLTHAFLDAKHAVFHQVFWLAFHPTYQLKLQLLPLQTIALQPQNFLHR